MLQMKLQDGSFLHVDHEKDPILWESYTKEELVFDQFGRRSTTNKFKDHQEALKFAEKNLMFVFAVRCYSHSGDSFYVVPEDWGNGDYYLNPFPSRTEGIRLPYPFEDQFDSGWAGYIMISAKLVMGGTTTLRERKEALFSSEKRSLAYEIVKDHIAYYNAYINGEVYMWEHLSADGEVLESCGSFISEEDAREDGCQSLGILLPPKEEKKEEAPAPTTLVNLSLSL